MTLRITIEIVPFGIEANKSTLYQIDVSSLGTRTRKRQTRYLLEQKIPDAAPWEDASYKIRHYRERGAITLARKALQRLERVGSHDASQNL